MWPVERWSCASQFFAAFAVFLSASACRNQAQVGSCVADDAATAEDARPLDGNAQAEIDGSVQAELDGSADFDSSLRDGDAGTSVDPSCPLPWVTVVIRDAASARIARFHTGGERPRRCSDLRAGGGLPNSTADAEALDPDTIVAVSPDEAFAIDVATDRVRWSRALEGGGTVTVMQAFLIRSTPPLMGVGRSPFDAGLFHSLHAIPADGGEVRSLPSPRFDGVAFPPDGIAADPASNTLFASRRNGGVHQYDPSIGLVTRSDFGRDSMQLLHASRGPERPRLVGWRYNYLTTAILGETWEFQQHAEIVACDGLSEAAPDPSHANRVFLRCGSDGAMYLLWHDTELHENEVVLGGLSTEPGLTLAGLGVVE